MHTESDSDQDGEDTDRKEKNRKIAFNTQNDASVRPGHEDFRRLVSRSMFRTTQSTMDQINTAN